MKKTFVVKTEYETRKVKIIITNYSDNGTLALLMETLRGEPYADITTNINDSDLLIGSDNFAYIDTNNCPWLVQFIKENKLGKDTGVRGFSGFCEYPLYEFDLSKLQ